MRYPRMRERAVPRLINAFCTNGGLDAEPEQGQDDSADDAEIAEPESK